MDQLTATTAEPRLLSQEEQAHSYIKTADGLFLTAAGTVDLLAMSNNLSPESFRRYIEASRLDRLGKRQPPKAT